jgi:hypothetical protein
MAIPTADVAALHNCGPTDAAPQSREPPHAQPIAFLAYSFVGKPLGTQTISAAALGHMRQAQAFTP